MASFVKIPEIACVGDMIICQLDNLIICIATSRAKVMVSGDGKPQWWDVGALASLLYLHRAQVYRCPGAGVLISHLPTDSQRQKGCGGRGIYDLEIPHDSHGDVTCRVMYVLSMPRNPCP